MQTNPFHYVLAPIVKKLKALGFSVAQKPSTKIEEYVLEHFLLYHNLVGSTPTNQPDFRIVQADIREALDNNNSTDLGIALKLPPLFWEERLQSIFAQLPEESRLQAVSLLMFEDSLSADMESDSSPLKHSNWRVRTNAANILAFLDAQSADQAIAQSLQQASDTDSTYAAAFCHLSYALGKLKTPFAKDALKKYLYDQEPWFRVDAVRALTLCPQEEVVLDLMQAMLAVHPLSDYMAAVIAKQYPLADLLAHSNKLIQSGAQEAVIGILKASQHTFSNDLLKDTSLWNCLPVLLNFDTPPESPQHLRAALMFINWWQNNSQLAPASAHELMSKCPWQIKLQMFSSPKVQQTLINTIQTLPNPSDSGEGHHAICLVGDLQIKPASSLLINFIQPDFLGLNDVIEALGKLGQLEAVPALLNLSKKLVNLQYRTSHALSQQPVNEENPQQAKTYWLILKALGNLPSPDGLNYLHEATQDFAADKRQQAYESYFCVCSSLACNSIDVKSTVIAGLHDPSPAIKIAALAAASDFGLLELLPAILKLCNSRELSLQQQAQQTVRNLYFKGKKQEILQKINTEAAWQFNSFKRQNLINLGSSLQEPQPISSKQ